MAYGTLQTLDTLESTFQTVADFGEDNAYDQLQAMLDGHNRILNDLYSDLVDRTTDKQRRYGTTDSVDMVKTDEWGRPDAQKAAPGAVAGFPLDSYQFTHQMTRKYMQTASVAEMFGQVVAAMDSDVRNVTKVVKQALYRPTNYTFDDYLTNRQTSIPLNVRALLNADGLGIPAGPNGETFNGGTHTHYLVAATPGSPIAADYVNLLETVLEHYATGQAIIAINRAQEASIRAMANFTPILNANLFASDNSTRFGGVGTLDGVQLYDREIGQFNGAQVWVKPWVVAGYPVAYIRNQPKVLCMRSRNAVSGNFVLVADDERYPLRAKGFEREFGVGVWNRTGAAVLDIQNGTYTEPTIS